MIILAVKTRRTRDQEGDVHVVELKIEFSALYKEHLRLRISQWKRTSDEHAERSTCFHL
jgi:hypothetical protein